MREQPPSVRLATYQDERALYDLLVEMWKGNSNGWNFPYAPEIVLQKIEQGTRPDPQYRSNPNDQCRGIIGVIDGPNVGELIGTVGIFIEPPVWFTREVVPTELWLYVRPSDRRSQHERALRDYALFIRERLKPEWTPYPFPLATGFMHAGKRYPGMQRLWQRLWPGARQVGSLFWID